MYVLSYGYFLSDEVAVVNAANELLDKIILKQLHLMEEKMCCELMIESSINNGSFQLAKSRYIMGQSSVSMTRLPTECSAEFEASTLCEDIIEDGTKQLKVIKNSGGITVNPMRWFGVLVPQNLHKAQSIFQNSINYVVECANIQLKILENLKNIEILKKYISSIKD
ncbi:hypothetical protein K1T71_012224 [Dendrolimus kikuchii]|uniref:Uncharacterized protein n=1 Tax=Dendrolimus kikuchii TaxID=765133 RepID=A0ACC1CLD1_9NEOP|nr:hypothetical protein K1T71_012224 [Dendrolimus kikuchii]